MRKKRNMRKIELNHNWTCKSLGEGAQEIAVTLPHDVMITEERSAQSLGIHNIGWFTAQDYVYTRRLLVPQDYAGKKVMLEIEGAYHNARVFLNGKEASYRPYGYSDFFVDTDGYLSYGEENVLQIYTYNSDQPNSRWYSGTGLYRPVSLHIADREAYIPVNGVKIRTLSYHPARIEVEVKTEGSGEVSVGILDGGVVVAQKQQTAEQYTLEGRLMPQNGAVIQFEIPDAKLWNVDTPHLYQCQVRFGTDLVQESFGIRLLEWNAEHGISVNGSRVILRGACIHHDNGVLGACAYPQAEERKVRILKENGYNTLRMAHNPCSKALLDACDRLGMLMMDEFVDVWYIHKTEHDYADYMEEWWEEDLKDMVEKDYNHPSVILYSTGNEVAETAQKRGIELTGQMTRYLHRLDATRPVTCGINIFFNFLSSVGLGVYSDEKAKKELEKTKEHADEIKNIDDRKKKKAVGSEFYNTLAGMFGDYTMKLGATLYPCDVKTRDAYAKMDIAGYNYGILRYRHDLKKYPNRLILGSETFCKDAYAFWEQAKRNPRIVGDFVWAGMDYIGEAGIGAWEYEDYAPADARPEGWLTAGSGRIDILGFPNGEALYTKVAFEQTDEIYLAVKPVYQTGKHSPSAWKMTEAMPSWSYPNCEGYPAEVEVYARAAEVELWLNGRKLGRKRLRKNCAVHFRTVYEKGELTAIAYDTSGRELGRSSLRTAESETVLSVLPEEGSIVPEGLAFIRLIYTDEAGIWKPMEKHRLWVTVDGGRLLGLGNACSYNTDGYHRDSTGTYYGRALAVVQSDGSGEVTVTVRDEVREYRVKLPLAAEEDL